MKAPANTSPSTTPGSTATIPPTRFTAAFTAWSSAPAGRITAITDPRGNSVKYQYDVYGNLTAVTDRMGNTTQITYRTDQAHYLDTVVDPLGRTGVRTNYATNGRLSSLTDSQGNATTMGYDLTALKETVTDSLNHATTVGFDQSGNVTDAKDPLNGETQAAY